MCPDSLEGALPRNFLRPCVLLLLREQPAHGYDLLERLRLLGFTRDDPGRLYRMLRSLEQEGLVHSSWEGSATGPDRRVYRLTAAGTVALHGQARSLKQTTLALERFLSRYEEFAALHEPRDSARAR